MSAGASFCTGNVQFFYDARYCASSNQQSLGPPTALLYLQDVLQLYGMNTLRTLYVTTVHMEQLHQPCLMASHHLTNV